MNTNNDKYDLKFRNLIRENGLENPGKEFTANIMDRIEELEKNAVAEKNDSKRSNWLWGFGISFLILLGFSIINYFNISLIPENIEPIVLPVFEGLLKSFKSIFAGVQVSSTTVVIILGFVLLVAVERILNKLKLTKNLYFSF